MNVELTEDALTDTWLDVERMIYTIIHGCIGRMGGDFDDCVGVASVAFMRAYDSWDHSRGAFTTHLYWRVSGAVRNHLRDEMRRAEVFGYNNDVESPDGEGRISGLLRELSTDAKLVVLSLFSSPSEITEAFIRNEVECPPELYLASLRARLRRLGWTALRVTESFSEIREALR